MWPLADIKKRWFKVFLFKGLVVSLFVISIASSEVSPPKNFLLNQQILQDKIKGGWAGQLIGYVLGSPYDHKFSSSILLESPNLFWSGENFFKLVKDNPEIFNDFFVELFFLEAFKKSGLNTSAKDLAKAFSRAPFPLHHGLQMAKHNLLIGLKPPRSGHWLHNPHADDNDFQKVADFLGLISPGMLTSVVKLGNRLGHIMASGDGYYGGIYVASLYSLAFLYDHSEKLVEEALKIFPAKATFTQVIRDVLDNYRRFPQDWSRNWQFIQKKWGEDIGCPEGVLRPQNFEAKINAAWITLGLLYGRGDLFQTLEITLRCGDETKNNAAAVGGILGTICGFSRLPSDWQKEWTKLESFKPKGLEISLGEANNIILNLALESIRKNGGKIEEKTLYLPSRRLSPLRYEVNFPHLYPKEKRELNLRLSEIKSETTIEFEGAGFVINGRIIKKVPEDHTYRVAIVVDGRLVGVSILPAHPLLRNPTPFFRFNLRPGKHRLFLQISEPSPKADIQLDEIIIYDKKPREK